MKIGTKLEFTCPDKCPDSCDLKPEHGYQGDICSACPVFNCFEGETEEDKKYLPVVPAHQFRNDWAEEWDEYFKTGVVPKLKLNLP